MPKNNNILELFAYGILALIPLVAAVVIYLIVVKAYATQKEEMIRELSAIEDYDKDAALREVSKELDIPYPVLEPAMTPEQIEKTVKEEAKKEAEKVYADEAFNEKKWKIISENSEVKKGDKVSVSLNTAKGKLEGVFKGFDGVYVNIDDMNYRIDDIADEQRHLFDPAVADKIINEKLSSLKDRFHKMKKEFAAQKCEELRMQYYPKNGYRKDGSDGWRPLKEIFDSAMAAKEREYARARKMKIHDIMMRHRLFGIFEIEVPAELKK